MKYKVIEQNGMERNRPDQNRMKYNRKEQKVIWGGKEKNRREYNEI